MEGGVASRDHGVIVSGQRRRRRRRRRRVCVSEATQCRRRRCRRRCLTASGMPQHGTCQRKRSGATSTSTLSTSMFDRVYMCSRSTDDRKKWAPGNSKLVSLRSESDRSETQLAIWGGHQRHVEGGLASRDHGVTVSGQGRRRRRRRRRVSASEATRGRRRRCRRRCLTACVWNDPAWDASAQANRCRRRR